MGDPHLTRHRAADARHRPFAKAVRAGDFAAVSGRGPEVDGQMVPGGIARRGERVILNLGEALALAGRIQADVLPLPCCLDDLSPFARVFDRHLHDAPPARPGADPRRMVDAGTERDAIAWRPGH